MSKHCYQFVGYMLLLHIGLPRLGAVLVSYVIDLIPFRIMIIGSVSNLNTDFFVLN